MNPNLKVFCKVKLSLYLKVLECDFFPDWYNHESWDLFGKQS